ncbi:YceI family protein [Alteraurantiacibacter buctensis]|nr:YceI family protein [Alteraurantiacibacter buctensis]
MTMTRMDATRYSTGAIWLHWLIAFALAAELALGFGMPKDASGFTLYQLHKSLGITILLLTLVRIGWRFARPAPETLVGGFQGLLVKAGHLGLYAFMLAAPLTGWAVVSTAPIDVPTLLWGVVPWPHLPLADGLNHTLEEAHELIAFAGMALFVGHVLAALYHHFLLKDATMARMSPKGAAGLGLAMLAGVLVLHFGLVAALPGHEEGEAEEAAEDAAPAPAASASAMAEDPLAEESPAPEASASAAAEDEAAGPPPSWAIQPGGTLRFTADNGGTAISGSFSRWQGTIAMDPENPAGADIAIRIDLASASIGDATQDEMLQGGDFFNTGANPTATFRSTSVEKTGSNSYRARGTLSLRGASRPQTITFTLGGSGARRQVSGSATVDRNAFGVGTGESAAGIAPNVRVEFSFGATSQ